MGNSDVQITVVWSPDKSTTFNAREWQVSQTNGVSLLAIQDKESSHVSYDIPLENVSYWTVDVGDHSSMADEFTPKDRYCDTCKIYFHSFSLGQHIHSGHDIFYSCCGAPNNALHDSNCSQHIYDESQQRFAKDGMAGDANVLAKTLDEAARGLKDSIINLRFT